MKRLILRADDLGYCQAVNYAIERTVKEGIIGSVGLMPNMPDAAHGLKLLEGTGVALGVHTNLCLGRPCADPARIPSLLDAEGNLKSSRVYREAWAEGEEAYLRLRLEGRLQSRQYHKMVEGERQTRTAYEISIMNLLPQEEAEL